MQDYFEDTSPLDFKKYWAIIRRRRWRFLLPLFLGWAIVWGISWILPETYRSEALIMVENQSVPEHIVRSNVAQTRVGHLRRAGILAQPRPGCA